MKRVNNFDDFVNEGFVDVLSKAAKSIKKGIKNITTTYLLRPFTLLWEKLTSKYKSGAWLYLAKYLQKIGFLKKHGIEFESYYDGEDIGELTKMEKKEYNDLIDLTQSGEEIDTMFEHLITERVRKGLEHPNINVPNYTPNELYEELLERFDEDKKRSVLIWGAPGLGKTQIVKRVAKVRKAACITFTLSQRDPTDFIGLPFTASVEYIPPEPEIDEEGKPITLTKRVSDYALPTFFPLNNGPNGNGGILFFDEMNRARQSVLGAAMQLFLEHTLDDYVLPSEWVVWSAANRAVDEPNATPTKLGAALSQRIAHMNIVASFPDWEEWAKETGRIHPDIVMFVKAADAPENSVFHSISDKDEEEEGPNPTPRSWEFASNSYRNTLKKFGVGGMNDFYKLSRSEYNKMKNKLQKKLATEVGNEVSTQFMEFLDVAQEIKPSELKKVYNDPMNAPLNIDPSTKKSFGPSRTYAFMNLVANAMKDEKGKPIKLTPEQLKNYFKWMERIADVKKDKNGNVISGNEEIATACLGLLKDYHKYLIKPVSEGGMSKDWAEATKAWNKIVDKTFTEAGE